MFWFARHRGIDECKAPLLDRLPDCLSSEEASTQQQLAAETETANSWEILDEQLGTLTQRSNDLDHQKRFDPHHGGWIWNSRQGPRRNSNWCQRSWRRFGKTYLRSTVGRKLRLRLSWQGCAVLHHPASQVSCTPVAKGGLSPALLALAGA